jgi:hypothetical protein
MTLAEQIKSVAYEADRRPKCAPIHTRKRSSEIPGTADRSPQATQKLVESEVARWSSVLKAAGATVN